MWEIGWHNKAALANCEEIETRKRHVKKTAILLSFFSYSFACLELGPENKVSKPPRQFSLFCLYCFFFWLAQETCTHYICIIVIFACTFQFTFVEFTSKNNACCMVFPFFVGDKKHIFFGRPVELNLWNYSQRFGSLKKKKNFMYVYKHMFSAFRNSTQVCFSCFFSCFGLFFEFVYNKNRKHTRLHQVLRLPQHRGPRTQNPIIFLRTNTL